RTCRAGRCEDAPTDAGSNNNDGCARNNDCPEGSVCQDGQCEEGEAPSVRLAAEPASVAIAFETAEDILSTQVALINRGSTTINIEEVTMEGSFNFALEEQLELPLRLVPEQSVLFGVVYSADDLSPDEATLWVRTDQETQRHLEIPLLSFTKNLEVPQNNPCLSVSPSSLRFGSVARGAHDDQTFVLQGCGDSPVTVNAIRRGRTFFIPLADAFTLEGAPAFPLTLGMGETQTITVRYTSGRAGNFFGFWEVASNDADTPVQRVNVRAETPRPAVVDQGLHIRMSWNTDLADVDMHLLAPGGVFFECPHDVYFSNPGPDWGQAGDFSDDPFLDLDDVDGHGPENINIEAPQAGNYTLLAHYYAAHGAHDTPMVTFEVFSFGQLVGTYGPTGLPQVGGTWDAVEIQWLGVGQAPVLRALGNVGRRNHGGGCF
ncbi:MAG: choice-of-anchor D domain-containing protein, partial [Myxococcota bacterium]|nr:choice-of-anchor D domain-containing protein [Myxococcota bacterium]